MSDLILAIDGGGSTCRAAVAKPGGVVLGRGKSGPANILTDPELALRHMEEAALNALAAAGLANRALGTIPAYIGLAGSTVARVVSLVLPRLPFGPSVIESDGFIALEGALGPADGSIAVLGTGTIYYLRHHGQIHVVGGWGHAVSDLGSGARIGRALLEEAILAHDGIRQRTPLIQCLPDQFGGSPAAISDFASSAAPAAFAAHAPLVFDHATTGDAAALRIVRQGAQAVNEALDRLVALGGQMPLCLLGGLAGVYAPWLADRHRARLVEPRADALAGAVALGLAHFGMDAGAAT